MKKKTKAKEKLPRKNNKCSILEELTKIFWWDVTNKVNDKLKLWLSPDVRLQDMEGVSQAKGCNGRKLIIDTLNLIVDKLKSTNSDLDIKKLCTLKRNHGSHTRFFIEGCNESTNETFMLGFGLEWSWCHVIVGIVIQYNCNDVNFFEENDIDEIVSYNDADDKWNPLMCYAFGVQMLPPYILPRPPHCPPRIVITILSCENLTSRLKGRILFDEINPFVTVTLGDTSLTTEVVKKSNNPIFNECVDGKHHPSNSMTLLIPDKMKFSSQQRSGFPSTSRTASSTTPTFESLSEIHNSELSASIHIAVNDKRHGWIDRLANVSIPLMSLKACSNSGEVTHMSIPLKLRRKHFGIRERVGIKSKETDISVVNPQDIENMRLDRETSMISPYLLSENDHHKEGEDCEDDDDDDEQNITLLQRFYTHSSVQSNLNPYLNLLITKEDVTASWLMSELDARDARRRLAPSEKKNITKDEKRLPAFTNGTVFSSLTTRDSILVEEKQKKNYISNFDVSSESDVPLHSLQLTVQEESGNKFTAAGSVSETETSEASKSQLDESRDSFPSSLDRDPSSQRQQHDSAKTDESIFDDIFDTLFG